MWVGYQRHANNTTLLPQMKFQTKTVAVLFSVVMARLIMPLVFKNPAFGDILLIVYTTIKYCVDLKDN